MPIIASDIKTATRRASELLSQLRIMINVCHTTGAQKDILIQLNIAQQHALQALMALQDAGDLNDAN